MDIKLSRRELLRDLGLLGAGITLTPVISSETALGELEQLWRAAPTQRPAWVKEVDKPTVEIDWNALQRYDYRNTASSSFAKYLGDADRVTKLSDQRAANLQKWLVENQPGYSLRDRALADAVKSYDASWAIFAGPQKVLTPMARGVPRWQGTPEEASAMVAAALRFLGASSVGFMEIDPKTTQKIFYSIDSDGKKLEFEDVDAPYENDQKRVIPNKARWMVVWTNQWSKETVNRTPTALGNAGPAMAYDLRLGVQRRAQEFLRGLGYMGIGAHNNSGETQGPAPAFGVMAGLGELSRVNRLLTPEFGPHVRVGKIITDLPLAPTKPINAGIMEFCKHCKKCAEACPSKALSFDDEPTWQVRGGWNNPGKKAFFEDEVKCYTYWMETGTSCTRCFAACPFSANNQALVHQLAKATAATVPALDGMLKNLHDLTFGMEVGNGAAAKDPNTWWTTDLSEYGL